MKFAKVNSISSLRRSMNAKDNLSEFVRGERPEPDVDGYVEPYGCGCPACLASGSTNVPPFRVDIVVNYGHPKV